MLMLTLFTETFSKKCYAIKLFVPIISCLNMNGQAKISAFFNRNCSGTSSGRNEDGAAGLRDIDKVRTPLKSKAANEEDRLNENVSVKRRRDENDNDSAEISTEDPSKKPHLSDQNITALSPQQKEKAEENRLKAKMMLIQKQTCGLVTSMGSSWFTALEAEFSKPYFVKLAKFVEDERKKHTVYPPPEQVFAWTEMTHIKETKVVILGQDPYHGPKQAHGLCFSVQKGIALPPSLENMYKELSKDIEGFVPPSHGCLVGWAKQGVLLLNAVLTVRAHSANSHKDKGWETFTDAVIAWLNAHTEGTVFILWGSYAHKKGAKISRVKHHVLQGVHPSPLSAYRGFFGCRHFSRCNELLTAQGKTPIDWTHFV